MMHICSCYMQQFVMPNEKPRHLHRNIWIHANCALVDRNQSIIKKYSYVCIHFCTQNCFFFVCFIRLNWCLLCVQWAWRWYGYKHTTAPEMHKSVFVLIFIYFTVADDDFMRSTWRHLFPLFLTIWIIIIRLQTQESTRIRSSEFRYSLNFIPQNVHVLHQHFYYFVNSIYLANCILNTFQNEIHLTWVYAILSTSIQL